MQLVNISIDRTCSGTQLKVLTSLYLRLLYLLSSSDFVLYSCDFRKYMYMYPK